MKMFVVNRRNRDQEPIPFGKGSSEGIPPEGALLMIERGAFKVAAVVVGAQNCDGGDAAVFLVCDPYRPSPETPETVEAGRDPYHVVRELMAR